MKIKFTFMGHEVVAVLDDGTRRLRLGNKMMLEVGLTEDADAGGQETLRRIWEMERAFNELTRGRLHVELLDK